MTTGAASELLLAATAVHAGFQLTVTAVVYPALVRTPEAAWADAHAAHSRRITPPVVLVYAAALVACVLAVAADPGTGTWIAVMATVAALLVTAFVAGPTHGRLATPQPALLTRLVTADRLRCALAWSALAGALAEVLV